MSEKKPKKKRKRKPKPKPGTKAWFEAELKKWEKRADKALSVFTREVANRMWGICPFCEQNAIQCCFHFVGRTRKILRWRRNNVIGACFACNKLEQHFPDKFRVWYIRFYGAGEYLQLVDEASANMGWQPSIEYLKEVKESCDSDYKKLMVGKL